jgi:NitT/TauT family transport system substrate-binding protein
VTLLLRTKAFAKDSEPPASVHEAATGALSTDPMEDAMQTRQRPTSKFGFVWLAALAMSGYAPATLAQTLEAASLRLDWTPISYHAPFYLAKARGYYRDAGIDLKMEDGRGSGTTIQLVGNQVDTFGLADASVVAKAIGQQIPVKLVMGIFRRSVAGIVFPAKNDIRTAADLKGKRVATCAGDAPLILLPAYLKAVNLDMNDLKVVTVDCGSKYTVVAQGLADVTLGFAPYGKTMFGTAGISEVRSFDYANAGLNLPSHGIIASQQTIETKPALIRRFVSATAKGWNEARSDPDAAITEMVASVALMKGRNQVLKTEFEGYANYLDTPATQGKPFGWQSPDDWKVAEDILVQYMDLKRQPSVDAYFTNQFVGG